MPSHILRSYRLRGFDTFEGEAYPLPGRFDTEAQAIEAARKRLEELERLQPTSSSGGQGFGGIQDQVFVVQPDGSSFRVFAQGAIPMHIRIESGDPATDAEAAKFLREELEKIKGVEIIKGTKEE